MQRLLWRVGIPIVDAVAVAAHAYYDTVQVGNRAIELLKEELKKEKKRKAAQKRRRKEAAQVADSVAPRTGTDLDVLFG